MVEVLLFPFPHAGIPDADGLFQIGGKLPLGFFGIASGKCVAECIQFWRVLAGFLMEPFHYLFDKDFFDFQVWNGQMEYIAVRFPPLGQVPGGKEYTPHMVNIFIQLPVGQLLTDCLFDTAAVDQQFDLISDD